MQKKPRNFNRPCFAIAMNVTRINIKKEMAKVTII